jgi:branched-chain amino acid transport system substrate-binding protein
MTRLQATLVTPLTGPLALFGQACATGLTIWANAAADLPVPWTEVVLTIQDAGKNTGEAIRAALETQPDVLFGPYGSSGMLAAARASKRTIWNHGGATSRLARPDFPQVVNVLAPASTYFASLLQAVRAADSQVRTVSLVQSTSGFGRDVAAGARQAAQALQWDVHTCTFAPSSPLSVVDMVPEADILLVVGNFADELALASRLLTRSWRFAGFVGAGVEEVLAPLGAQREGLLGPAQWIATAAPPPDEGPDAAWLTAAYRTRTGEEAPYPAVQAFATGLLCARCLRESRSCEDTQLLAAAQQLRCTTLYGSFQLDPLSGLQAGHQVLIVQWQQGQRYVVWPPEQAERPLLALPRSSDF